MSDLKDPSDYGTYVSDPLVGERAGCTWRWAASCACSTPPRARAWAWPRLLRPSTPCRAWCTRTASWWCRCRAVAFRRSRPMPWRPCGSPPSWPRHRRYGQAAGSVLAYGGARGASFSARLRRLGRGSRQRLPCLRELGGTVRFCGRSATRRAGYYWSGAALVDDWLVVGDDAGVLSVRSSRRAWSRMGLTWALPSVRRRWRARGKAPCWSSRPTACCTRCWWTRARARSPRRAGCEVRLVEHLHPHGGGRQGVRGRRVAEGVENEWGYVTYGGVLAVIDEGSLALEREVLTYGEGRPAAAGRLEVRAPRVDAKRRDLRLLHLQRPARRHLPLTGGRRLGPAHVRARCRPCPVLPVVGRLRAGRHAVLCERFRCALRRGGGFDGRSGGDGSGGEGGGSQGPVDSNLPAGPNTPVGGEGRARGRRFAGARRSGRPPSGETTAFPG